MDNNQTFPPVNPPANNLPPSEENYFDSAAGQGQYQQQQYQQYPQYQPVIPEPQNTGVFQPTAQIGQQPAQKKPSAPWSTFQLVIVIVIGAAAVLFLGLFIWMLVMWSNASSDVQGQIDSAVATAVKDTTTKLENDFAEQEKYPYKTFVGPADYGELSFEYPKTWSLYIADDASSSGRDYLAYLNPDSVSTDTLNALVVNILNTAVSDVTSGFERDIADGTVRVSTHIINGANASIFTGEISRDMQGIAAVFKIRDKTVMIQTEAMIFQDDFYRLLDTIKYNN